MLLAAGVSINEIQEILGQATSSFTADVYTEVATELEEAAAAKIEGYVPRAAGRASTAPVQEDDDA